MLKRVGVVHAWVGQKLVNSNILRVFCLRSLLANCNLNDDDINQVLSR